MSLSLEPIFSSDGSELSHGSHNTTLSAGLGAPFNAEFDGKYVWVTCSNGIAIYEYWGEYYSGGVEPAFTDYDDLDGDLYNAGTTQRLRMVTALTITSNNIKRTTRAASLAESGASTVTLASGESAYYKSTSTTISALVPKYIARSGDKMYVTNGTNFKEIFEFDINTHLYVRTINVKETFGGTDYGMNSNLLAAAGKLWMVGTFFSDAQPQKMYIYDLATDVKTGNDILVRPQLARSWLAPGYNGAIYITDYNNVSVTKYDVDDASYMTQIRMNALPSSIWTTPERRIFVSSYAGMLTLIDWDDDQMHNDFGSQDTIMSLVGDPTDGAYAWFVRADGVLVRYDLNNIEQLETNGGEEGGEDWEINGVGLDQLSYNIITPTFTYTNSLGADQTINPFMFVLGPTFVKALRMDLTHLDRITKRQVFAELNGQAAVTGGALTYFGETG